MCVDSDSEKRALQSGSPPPEYTSANQDATYISSKKGKKPRAPTPYSDSEDTTTSQMSMYLLSLLFLIFILIPLLPRRYVPPDSPKARACQQPLSSCCRPHWPFKQSRYEWASAPFEVSCSLLCALLTLLMCKGYTGMLSWPMLTTAHSGLETFTKLCLTFLPTRCILRMSIILLVKVLF